MKVYEDEVFCEEPLPFNSSRYFGFHMRSREHLNSICDGPFAHIPEINIFLITKRNHAKQFKASRADKT